MRGRCCLLCVAQGLLNFSFFFFHITGLKQLKKREKTVNCNIYIVLLRHLIDFAPISYYTMLKEKLTGWKPSFFVFLSASMKLQCDDRECPSSFHFMGLVLDCEEVYRWLLNSKSIYTSVRNLALLDNLFDKHTSCITLGKVSFVSPPRKKLQLILYWRRNTSLINRVIYVFVLSVNLHCGA